MAKYTNGRNAENDIDLNIIVEDMNDCTPVIEAHQVGSVNESSTAGTSGTSISFKYPYVVSYINYYLW